MVQASTCTLHSPSSHRFKCPNVTLQEGSVENLKHLSIVDLPELWIVRSLPPMAFVELGKQGWEQPLSRSSSTWYSHHRQEKKLLCQWWWLCPMSTGEWSTWGVHWERRAVKRVRKVDGRESTLLLCTGNELKATDCVKWNRTLSIKII